MNYNQPKTETSVSIETENKRTEIFNQSKQFFLKVFWSDVYKEMEDIDEVDNIRAFKKKTMYNDDFDKPSDTE